MEHRAGSMRPYATLVRFFFDLAPGLASITGEGFPVLLLCVASVTGGALRGFATVDRPSTVGTRGVEAQQQTGVSGPGTGRQAGAVGGGWDRCSRAAAGERMTRSGR